MIQKQSNNRQDNNIIFRIVRIIYCIYIFNNFERRHNIKVGERKDDVESCYIDVFQLNVGNIF